MSIVLPFSEDALSSSLSNKSTTPSTVKAKNQFKYLYRYLSDREILCKTIVVEERYTSKDYLHDYSSYYSLCHEQYAKECKRIHFFSLTFNETDLNDMLLGKFQEISIPGSYLGFIVVKPIPHTVIGFTLLKTYTGSSVNRQFWGIKKYPVHLHGKEFTVESLAFQEQDTVLAACATTAIWSMLSKASNLQTGPIKTPSEITKDAGHISPDGSRLFPNKGLNIYQICEAIYKSNLVTEVKQPDIDLPKELIETAPVKKVVSKQYLKKILNAYSALGIPIILVVAVPTQDKDKNISYGFHAIAVSGFKEQKTPIKIPSLPGIVSWRADNIDRFYAHDDQWGPFVRIDWLDDYRIKTLWDFPADEIHTFVYRVIVPTFPKVRIPYEDIQVIVDGLDTILTSHWDNHIKEDLVWDIKVDYSENYKSQVLALNPSTFPNKIHHLQKSLPKYVWIATCFIGELPILKFIFDATGVSNAMLCIDILSLLPQTATSDLHNFLVLNRNKKEMLDVFDHPSRQEYYTFLIDNLLL